MPPQPVWDISPYLEGSGLRTFAPIGLLLGSAPPTSVGHCKGCHQIQFHHPRPSLQTMVKVTTRRRKQRERQRWRRGGERKRDIHKDKRNDPFTLLSDLVISFSLLFSSCTCLLRPVCRSKAYRSRTRPPPQEAKDVRPKPSAAAGFKNKAPTTRGQGCKAKALSSNRLQEQGPHHKRPRM